MTLIIMPVILPLFVVRKLDVSVSKVKYPKIIIETTLIAITMNCNITVIDHDHFFPFNNP